MSNNIFEKMTEEERTSAWMYMIFNKDIIMEKTKQLTKEAEKAGMTLTEYLESISPWPDKNGKDCEKEIKMKNYKITVTDTATYIIRADSLENAENLAVEWFDKREPMVNSQETDEEAEYIIAEE